MAPTSLLPGSIFATDFRIVRTLGEGGMGAVYVAEQLSTGKQRALKTMHPQFVADAGLRERFAQEARIGARVESEHVVDVVAAGIDAATKMPWLAMELLKGETVAEAVARGRTVEPRFAQESLLQLGDAIAEGHRVGVVHRDLKPENLFLTTTKRSDVPFVLKVLDFGIAKLLSEGGSSATAAIGSPLWMAPEQTERGGSDTPATDVWAYGLIAFYVIAGQSYWHLKVDGREVSAAVLLRQIVLDPLSSASERAGELGIKTPLPVGFDGWFARCVARDPAARFNDGSEARARGGRRMERVGDLFVLSVSAGPRRRPEEDPRRDGDYVPRAVRLLRRATEEGRGVRRRPRERDRIWPRCDRRPGLARVEGALQRSRGARARCRPLGREHHEGARAEVRLLRTLPPHGGSSDDARIERSSGCARHRQGGRRPASDDRRRDGEALVPPSNVSRVRHARQRVRRALTRRDRRAPLGRDGGTPAPR